MSIRKQERETSRLHVVVVGWDHDRTAQTCTMIERSLARSRTPVGARILVANNAACAEQAPGYSVLQGDNNGLDIGGMGAGVRNVLEVGNFGDRDGFLVVNDMLPHYERRRPVLAHVRPETVQHVIASDALAGKVWSSPTRHELLGMPSIAWVQTHCFVIGVDLARRVDLPYVFTEAGSGAFRFDAHGALQANALMDAAFAEFVEHGLVRGRTSDPQWIWHRAQEWDAGEADFLTKKALTILRERLLSASVAASGGQLLDVDDAFAVRRPSLLPSSLIVGLRQARGVGRLAW